MKRIQLLKIYGWERKSRGIPDLASPWKVRIAEYQNVPIYQIGVLEMSQAVDLQDVDVIKNNRQDRILILTDGNRVLVVNHEGYDYARYKGQIDSETLQHVLQLIMEG
ncbi:hypothetical protein [Effusibacillus consociatus]|uniref:DUF4367 domain-containing protein n=1 Tax=Effusibacillus consociatus TaxID=1117041 RepID=A0ABV9PY24_9BACL